MSNKIITFENVSKIYPPNTVALDNINFSIEEGEFVSLVGKSGAGKTTILKLVLGEEKPTNGKVFFDGIEINKINSSKLPLLRREIGVIFQDYKLLEAKTVFENVAFAMEVIGASDKEIENDVPKVLEIVGLLGMEDKFPAELSGGEKQRVSIARALIHRPKLILADEPTGNLDPYHTRDIIKLLLKINEFGTAIVLATHDKEIINSLLRRVVSLRDGKIIRDDEKGRFIL